MGEAKVAGLWGRGGGDWAPSLLMSSGTSLLVRASVLLGSLLGGDVFSSFKALSGSLQVRHLLAHLHQHTSRSQGCSRPPGLGAGGWGLGDSLVPDLQKRLCDRGTEPSRRSGRASWRRPQLRGQPEGCRTALGHSSRQARQAPTLCAEGKGSSGRGHQKAFHPQGRTP